MLGASFSPSPHLRRDWGWWGTVWHWAAKLVGSFPCSHESRGGDLLLVCVQAFAGLVPSSFPASNARAGETLCFPGCCGIPPRSFRRLRKAILTTGDIGSSMVRVCLSVDHFFSTSFGMLIRMLFFNFFE